MSQSAATFFGFWEGVRGSQYQNQLPNGAVVELRQAGAKHKGGAGGGGLFGPQGPGNPTAPSPSDPCIEDTVPMPYVASKTPEDCYDYCRSHADNLSGYAACLFNCYGGAIGEGGCACPSGDGPYFSLPDFQQVHLVTQLCFAVQYSDADWPETCCCPPPLNATTDCSPPTELECALMRWAIPCREWVDDQPTSTLKNDRYGAATPTEADRELFGAGIAVLLKNMDVVLWLSCLVQNWSPELRGLDLSRYILQLLTPDGDGQFPLTVSYVERADTGGAHMWAYTVATQCTTTLRDPFGMVQFHLPCRVGVIVAVSHDNWTRRMRAWRSGGTAAFCAAVQVASEILHEIVHIIGDGYNSGVVGAEDSMLYPTYPDKKYGADPSHNINEVGTLHEQIPNPQDPNDSIDFPTPCWDEGRMLGTMLLWAMSQRYTCLVSNNCCSFMDRPEYFAYSTGTVCQLGAKCFESSCS